MTERLLSEQIVGQIREAFTDLKHPVDILFFGKKMDCEYCDDTLRLVSEIVEISDLLSLQVFDLESDSQIAREFNVDKAPGLVLLGGSHGTATSIPRIRQDFGVRFAGIPSGYEFSSFIHSLILVSGRNSGLGEETRNFLKQIDQPVLLQVFVTPT